MGENIDDKDGEDKRCGMQGNIDGKDGEDKRCGRDLGERGVPTRGVVSGMNELAGLCEWSELVRRCI